MILAPHYDTISKITWILQINNSKFENYHILIILSTLDLYCLPFIIYELHIFYTKFKVRQSIAHAIFFLYLVYFIKIITQHKMLLYTVVCSCSAHAVLALLLLDSTNNYLHTECRTVSFQYRVV